MWGGFRLLTFFTEDTHTHDCGLLNLCQYSGAAFVNLERGLVHLGTNFYRGTSAAGVWGGGEGDESHHTHVLAVAAVAEGALGAAARELAALAHDVHHARLGVLGAEFSVLAGAVPAVAGGVVAERVGVAERGTLEAGVELAALGGDVHHAFVGVGPAELDLGQGARVGGRGDG